MDNNQLTKFIDTLSVYQRGSPFTEGLLIESEGNLDVFFSPFEHINKLAKVVLVGISPGATQANNANMQAKELLEAGESLDVVSEKAKRTGAFSGQLQNNLVRLLDYIGINRKLNISSCDSLFSENQNLLHSTSVFRYPTLVSGQPISSAIRGLKSPLLRRMVDTCLVDEIKQLHQSAFYLPMGTGVDKILLDLCEKGVLSRNQLLIGMPHPSGANAERIAYFLGSKSRSELSNKTNPDKIDEAKEALLRQVSKNFTNNKVVQLEERGSAPESIEKTSSKRSIEQTKPAKDSLGRQVDKSHSNMLSPSDGYMLASTERQIKEQLAELSLSTAPTKSRTSKEMPVVKGTETIAYVSRKTGLKKGFMVVTLHPKTARKVDNLVEGMEGVTIRPGRRSRYISSSNYNGFNSKGYTSELQSNEHQAAAYDVDIRSGLLPLKLLLTAC